MEADAREANRHKNADKAATHHKEKAWKEEEETCAEAAATEAAAWAVSDNP